MKIVNYNKTFTKCWDQNYRY